MRAALGVTAWFLVFGCVDGNGTLDMTGMGGTPGSGGGNGTGQGAALCTADCQQQVRCQGATTNCAQDQSVVACLQTEAPLFDSLFRDDFLKALLDCLNTTCGSGDQCFTTAYMKVGIDPLNDPGLQRCLSRHSECQSQGSSWSDDFCSDIPILKSGPAAQARACLDRACAEINACLDQIVGR